ncbi:ABC transporter permease subunit [Cytobacillus depressus]|uniref:ABC transporter permease subunit n=1 Tax=Cytobacillus depressus TaxID=1602942 RepID=A0A6L3V2C7_9BACI|nr:ABC transporter permease [Cytobacillus depressus]KAB2333140.1 ABC transporter permease subunit [Cytobacillus depressus]
MVKNLMSDFIKMKRKMIWFLIFLGPFGVVALEAVNYGLRYDYLTKIYEADLWGGLIGQASFLAIPALMLGLTIISSMIAGIEHQTNAWKQLLALPISRLRAFTGKFMITAILLFLSSTLLFVGIIILGIGLKFGTDMPILSLLKMAYFTYFAAMPFMAFQLWLSVTIKNQAIPLTIGILSTIVTLGYFDFPDWFPWNWLYLNESWNSPLYSALAGLGLGLIIYLLGTIDFGRKDVQ